MINYQYGYLIGCLVILLFWVILFLIKKDFRKEMISISIIFGIAGALVDTIYMADCWKAQTITTSFFKIESFLFGFGVAGIASVFYEYFSNKRLQKIKKKKLNKKKRINLLIIGLVLISLFFGGYFFLKLHSFYSSVLAFLVAITIIWVRRKDLIINSFLSGIILTVFSFLAYFIPELILPGWLNSSWFFEKLSGITFLKIPIEDLIWFFLAGLLIGPLYEYWQEAKLINLKNIKSRKRLK
jgi:hypothetical protein